MKQRYKCKESYFRGVGYGSVFGFVFGVAVTFGAIALTRYVFAFL